MQEVRNHPESRKSPRRNNLPLKRLRKSAGCATKRLECKSPIGELRRGEWDAGEIAQGIKDFAENMYRMKVCEGLSHDMSLTFLVGRKLLILDTIPDESDRRLWTHSYHLCRDVLQVHHELLRYTLADDCSSATTITRLSEILSPCRVLNEH